MSDHTSSGTAYPDAQAFDALWSAAGERMEAFRVQPAEDETRIELWKKQEFHNWLRWRICRKGFDWSKPGVILLNAAGFLALVLYGFRSGNFYITAGGIVAWFTLVNLSFFTYFGLTLPGPPVPLAFPAHVLETPELRYRSEMGLYPAGYERRKLARVWLRLRDKDGGTLRFEMAFGELPAELRTLVKAQSMWRMQRGDAPLTRAVVKPSGASREQIDAGAKPLDVVAFHWDEQALVGFERGR